MSLIFPCYILHSCRSIRWHWLVALSVVSAVLVGGTSPCSSKAEDAAENGAELETQFRADVAPFLKTNCLDCHGSEDPAAKLDLSGYTSSEKVAKDHQTWAIVLDRLRAGEMPPKHAEPQPTRQQRDSIIKWINSARDFEAARNAGDPGPVLARRLSNAEYDYTIRDLTGVDIRPTNTFPVDPANEAGFDNTGETLTMSPALLKKYLDAARDVVEHLVLKPDGIAFASHPVVTNTDRDKYCVKRIVQFYERQPTELAMYFQAAWRVRQAVSGLSGRAALELALKRAASECGISSKYLETVWDILTDGEHNAGPVLTLREMWDALPTELNQQEAVAAGCRKMGDFVERIRKKLSPQFDNLYIEGSHKGSQPFVLWKNRQHASHRRQVNRSALRESLESVEKVKRSVESQSTEVIPAERKLKSATSVVDDELVPQADSETWTRYEAASERFCAVFPDAFYIDERGRDYVAESSKQDGEKGRLLSAGFHSMMGYFRDDRPLYDMILDEKGQTEIDALWRELDFVASAPTRQYVGFLWFERTDSRYMRDPQFDFARAENKAAASEALISKLGRLYLEKARASGGTEVPLQAIAHFFREINDQIRWVEQARLKAEPGHVAAVQDFAERAFRRNSTESERRDLASFYRMLRDVDGLSHEEAIQDTIVSILMSPLFCYRVDLIGHGDGQRPLTDEELASRLSYFLWSSTPDEGLLAVAGEKRLSQKDELIRQTRRMLKDSRVRGMATEFGGNWLDIRRFEEHNAVDRDRFPEFTDDLRQAMFEEPMQFFIDAVQNDRSVLGFLDADHTFVDSQLARHYGMQVDVVRDGGWSRVDRAGEYGRGGLLPMSVFLTKNAPGLRTSPVKRGYWVVRRLLGERIPPPPPNVPELPDDESELGELTLRETLAKHRDHASCAVCHERFDSIGLAFEGFGSVGKRRDVDLGGRPIDATAHFPDGEEGNGVGGLRSYLLTHRSDEFVNNLVRKLVSYALGRSLILSDELLIRDIHSRLRNNDHRFAGLIENIVTSPQFLNKRGSSHLVRE